jgi:hypothetical protein
MNALRNESIDDNLFCNSNFFYFNVFYLEE